MNKTFSIALNMSACFLRETSEQFLKKAGLKHCLNIHLFLPLELYSLILLESRSRVLVSDENCLPQQPTTTETSAQGSCKNIHL